MDEAKGNHKIHATISIDPAKWKRFQDLCEAKLNMKASPNVERLIDDEMARLEGKETSTTLDLERVLDDLERREEALVEKRDKVKKILEAHGVLAGFQPLLDEYGLNFETYANANQVIAKILELMIGPPLKGVSYTKENLNFLTTLLSVRKELKELQTKILGVKTKMFLPDR